MLTTAPFTLPLIQARRARRILPAALVAAFALAACGGGDDDADGIASLEDVAGDTAAPPDGSDPPGDASDGTTTATTEPRDVETALLEFAACMRSHGVDMPDPQVDEHGRIQVQIGVGAGPGDPDAVDEAQEACADLMPQGPLSGDNDQFDPTEMQDQLLEFTRCMREHGVEIDDPDFDEDGRIGQVTATVPEGDDAPRGPVLAGPFGTLDMSDPNVVAAFEECGSDTGFGPPPGESPAPGGPGGDRGSDGDE